MRYEVVMCSRWGESLHSTHKRYWTARLVFWAYRFPLAPCTAYIQVRWESADTARERLDWIFKQSREGGAWTDLGERKSYVDYPNGAEVCVYRQAMRWVWL